MSLVGKKAPDFKLPAVVGEEFKTVSLSDYKGKWVVLFFYPLDFTFVCPTEILEFSKRANDFKEAGAQVIGASVDSKHSHLAWIKGDLGKLNYPLVADINKTLARDYDALAEDEGIALRATFVIDPDGKVAVAHYNGLDIGRSVDEALRVLQAAQTGDRCPVNWKPGQKTLGK